MTYTPEELFELWKMAIEEDDWQAADEFAKQHDEVIRG